MGTWIELQVEQSPGEGEITTGSDSDGNEYAVCRVNGQIHVLGNRCLHQGGPLGEGFLTGTVLACPWHGWEYEVSSGRCLHQGGSAASCFESRLDGSTITILREE